VERIEQHRAYVRVHSEGLFFGDTGLRFGEYFVLPGEQVSEGQLLAKLDTEWIEREIEEQEDRLERTRRDLDFELRFLLLDVDTAMAEHAKLVREAAFDPAALQAVENKGLEVQRLELNLRQARERHELTLRQNSRYLDELKTRYENAHMYAPYDGVITHLVERWRGQYVEPFAGMVYLSNSQNIYVESISEDTFSVGPLALVFGIHGDVSFALQRVPLTRPEAQFYITRRLPQPMRFVPLNPDEPLPEIGSLVQLRIHSNIREDVLRIPLNTVFSDPEMGTYVYRIENGQMTPTPVEIGIRSNVFLEIVSGLNEGDEIYVRP
jgi:macrolide-specific efflux system membrane fusion protein